MSKDCKQLFSRDQLAMAHSLSHMLPALQKYPDAVTPLDTTLCTLPPSSCISTPAQLYDANSGYCSIRYWNIVLVPFFISLTNILCKTEHSFHTMTIYSTSTPFINWSIFFLFSLVIWELQIMIFCDSKGL